MGGILQELATRHNLTVRNSQAWGIVDGYWFEIQLPLYGSTVMNIRTAVKFTDEEAEKAVAQGLEEMQAANRALTSARKDGRVVVSMKKPTGAAAADAIESVILRLVAIFHKAGATPACYSCGAETPDGFAMVNDVAIKLCSRCQAGIESSITKKTEQYYSEKNNTLRGLAGALVGALIGAVAWVLLGSLGWMAAIAGFAISFCAIKGYAMMKGKVTGLAIAMICILCLALMVLAQYTLYDVMVIRDYISQGYQVDYMKLISQTFEVPFLIGEGASFISNLGLGVLFLVLGSWRVMVPLLRQAKSPGGKFERL